MEDISFGSGANTPTGDVFSAAIVKLKARVIPLESGGSGTTPSVAAPTIAGNATDGSTLTATPARAGSSGKWTRDGVAISGATGLTYVYSVATDAGRYIQYEETLSGVTTVSNAILSGASSLTYATSFAGADNTDLNGFENWAQTSGQTFATIGNDLVQIAPSPDKVKAIHATAGNDFEVEFTPYTLAPSSGNRSPKYIFLRYTDINNYVVFNLDYNNYSITKRVAGADTALKSYTGRSFDDGVPVRLRVQGDWMRVYYNGSELSDSSTANNGQGFDVSGVPAASQIGISGSQSTSLTYPQKFLYSLAIYALPADGISFNATISNPTNIPSRQVVRIAGTTQGSITQPQALIMSSTGKVLQNWTSVTLSNKTFAANLPEITPDAMGDAVVIWMRDAKLKSITRTGLLPGGKVPIQHLPIPYDFGLNTQGTLPYNRGSIFVDLFKTMALGVRGSGFYFAAMVGSHINVTGTALVDSNGKPVVCRAADAGMRSDGWPTAAPRTGAWPSDSRIALQFNPGSAGCSPEQAGTYDVTFTPGLDWSVDSASTFQRTAYNLAAGTATIVVTGNLSGQVTPFIDFISYNGVANTFPPAGQAFFKSVRRGENSSSAFTAKTISSFKGLTSAAKTRPAGVYAGALRFMTNNDINGPPKANWEFTNTRMRVPQTRLGYITNTGPITVEEMLNACVEAGTHLWLNIPDTADPSLVLGWATYLNNNMPRGMKVYTEFSNEIVFNFAFGFAQFFRMNGRAQAAGVGYRTQLSREIKSRLALPFHSVFGMADDRWNLVVGMAAVDFQGGDTNSDAKLAEMLDEGGLYQYTRGTCIAAYVGNGLNYADGGSNGGFMSKASRDKAGIDDTGWLDDYYAAQILMSDWTRLNYWNPQCNALARYNAKWNLPRGQIVPMLYEYSWQHSDEKDNNEVGLIGTIAGNVLTVSTNNNGPLRTNDVLVGSGISATTKVLEQLTVATGALPGKEGTYRVSINQNVPTTTITSSTNLYAYAAGAAMAKALRDPRAGTAVNYMDAWLRTTGGVLMHFDHVGYTPPTLYQWIGASNWGYMEEIGREAIDEPYISVARDMAVNG